MARLVIFFVKAYPLQSIPIQIKRTALPTATGYFKTYPALLQAVIINLGGES
jgi:hypothetical protein